MRDSLSPRLFHRQVKKCRTLQHDVNIYDRAAEGSAQRSYKFLHDAANAHANRKRLEKNRERIARQTGPPSAPAAARVPKGYCFSFVKNVTCNKGDSCKFKHEVPQERGRQPGKGTPEGGRSRSQSSTGGGNKVNQIYKFFKQGKCDGGVIVDSFIRASQAHLLRQTLNLEGARGIRVGVVPRVAAARRAARELPDLRSGRRLPPRSYAAWFGASGRFIGFPVKFARSVCTQFRSCVPSTCCCTFQ